MALPLIAIWAALAVAGRVLPAGLVLSAVQRTGHGP